jgi:hypothetical protein
MMDELACSSEGSEREKAFPGPRLCVNRGIPREPENMVVTEVGA